MSFNVVSHNVLPIHDESYASVVFGLRSVLPYLHLFRPMSFSDSQLYAMKLCLFLSQFRTAMVELVVGWYYALVGCFIGKCLATRLEVAYFCVALGNVSVAPSCLGQFVYITCYLYFYNFITFCNVEHLHAECCMILVV